MVSKTAELKRRWTGIELKLKRSQIMVLKRDMLKTFPRAGTPICSQTCLECAWSISTLVGAFRTCMKKFEDAMMRVEMMFSARCTNRLTLLLRLQLPSEKIHTLDRPPALTTELQRRINIITAKPAVVIVLMTAVRRQPELGNTGLCPKADIAEDPKDIANKGKVFGK